MKLIQPFLTTFTLLGCFVSLGCDSSDSSGDGAGGSGAGGDGGADVGGAGAGGSGGEGVVCGAGGGASQPGSCPSGEICFSCTSDDESEGEVYSCREEPVVGAGEFRCFFGACEVASEYCRLVPDDLCAGDYVAQTCEPLPAGCGAAPSCDCLDDVPCVVSCEVTDEGLTVEIDPRCED